jgi:hypothetical protein
VGSVRDVVVKPDVLYGRVAINDPHLDRFLLNAERRGRLVETLGLSVRGRAVTLPPDYGDAVLWFGHVISLDIVDGPLGGGCLIQSDAAEAAGAAWPALPKIIPSSRPAPARARERGSSRRIRSAPAHEALATEFRIIPEGADY